MKPICVGVVIDGHLFNMNDTRMLEPCKFVMRYKVPDGPIEYEADVTMYFDPYIYPPTKDSYKEIMWIAEPIFRWERMK